MNITHRIIEANGGLLTSLLIYKEFSFDQAVRFLPQAIHAIVGAAIHEKKVQPTVLERNAFMVVLNERIDVGLLAMSASIDPAQVKEGILVLLPKVLELIDGNSGSGSAEIDGGNSGWFTISGDLKGKHHCDD